MSLSYLIIDDEPLAHDVIEEYCKDLSFMALKGNCYNALEAINVLNKHSVDLLFLDLNMPKLKGFDFLRTLEKAPKVIVTSAYKEYALEGFELNVSDYLLKPFSFERFLKAVNKVKETTSSLDQETKQSDIQTPLIIKGKNRYHQVDLNDIYYIEASGNYSKIILKRNEIITQEKISSLEETLDTKRFIRVHKSFIVAINKIKEIQANQILLTEKVVPIGRMYKMNVENLVKQQSLVSNQDV